MNISELPEWFKIARSNATFQAKEVALLLSVTTSTLYRQLDSGKFPKPKVDAEERERSRSANNPWLKKSKPQTAYWWTKAELLTIFKELK